MLRFASLLILLLLMTIQSLPAKVMINQSELVARTRALLKSGTDKQVLSLIKQSFKRERWFIMHFYVIPLGSHISLRKNGNNPEVTDWELEIDGKYQSVPAHTRYLFICVNGTEVADLSSGAVDKDTYLVIFLKDTVVVVDVADKHFIQLNRPQAPSQS